MNMNWKVYKNKAVCDKEPQEDNMIINQMIMTEDNSPNLL